MDISALIGKMLIFMVLMVVGYAAARTGRISPQFTKDASWAMLNVFMTASIINSAIGSVPELNGKETLNMLLVLFLTILLLYVIAALAARLICRRGKDEGLAVVLIAAVNSLFIGLPVVQEYGSGAAAFYLSLSCLPYNIFLYTYGVYRIRASGEKNRIRMKDMLSPPLIAAFIALLLFIFKIPVPKPARELLTALSNATMPLSMLVIGTSLGSVKLSEAFGELKTYLLSFVRLIVSPLLVWLAVRCLTDDPYLLCAMTVVAACPSGISVTALAITNGSDPVFSSKNILANTVLSMITIPLLVSILF